MTEPIPGVDVPICASQEAKAQLMEKRERMGRIKVEIQDLKEELSAAFKRGKLEGVFASPDEGEVGYVRGLEQQLSAEREKLKPLVDALRQLRPFLAEHGHDNALVLIDGTLAKVKE